MGSGQKPEDFVGETFNNGKLKVIGISDYTVDRGRAVFKVTCTECSKDKELFPEGYFNVVKSSLLAGSIPCGCSKTTKWEDWQYLILSRRAGEGRFIVHGFAEKFKGSKTKLNLECLKDGHRWSTAISNIIYRGQGCSKCAFAKNKKVRAVPQPLAEDNCTRLCNDVGYTFLGFIEKYENCYSKLRYICPHHGEQIVTYRGFVTRGSRCLHCYREISCFYGWYPERADEQDYLYILNFNDQFIKVGRSFNLEERISNLKKPSVSGIKNIDKIYIFTGTHRDVYKEEQYILNHLRCLGLSYITNWSNETFESSSLLEINKTVKTLPLKLVAEALAEQEKEKVSGKENNSEKDSN